MDEHNTNQIWPVLEHEHSKHMLSDSTTTQKQTTCTKLRVGPPLCVFDRDSGEGECQLPERCGKFGLYEDNQCVACPTPNGLSGWSRDCDVKKVTSCKAGDFHYYKLEGVDHFMIKYTRGDVTKQSQCESKCTSDCKCMGYFYDTDRSRCWIACDLKTLTRVGNSSNLGYIKTPNK